MLRFDIVFGFRFYKPVCFCVSFVPVYGNEFRPKEIINLNGLNILKPNANLNHSIINLSYLVGCKQI